VFGSFRSLARQNLMQTVISGATFGGANGILLPMGVLWLLGRVDLVPVMMVGAVAGVVVDATIMYRVFEPAGVATAECLIAGDAGGKRARLLGAGGALGGLGQLVGLPMDVFGVCWIGNMWALTAFGLGLLVRGYSGRLLGVDVTELHLPHGVMIGAGLAALVQIGLAVGRSRRRAAGTGGVSDAVFGRALVKGLVGFAAVAALLSALGGLNGEMSPWRVAAFILFAAVAALVSELIVGISAMHAGWFPAFATALIFLVLGMLLGFAMAAVVVFFTHEAYFARDLVPPVDRVFVATIGAATSPELARTLLIWAVPGALIQWAGGPGRQLGILLATGLLIFHPVAGWTVIVSLAVRWLLLRRYGERVQGPMYVLAGGVHRRLGPGQLRRGRDASAVARPALPHERKRDA